MNKRLMWTVVTVIEVLLLACGACQRVRMARVLDESRVAAERSRMLFELETGSKNGQGRRSPRTGADLPDYPKRELIRRLFECASSAGVEIKSLKFTEQRNEPSANAVADAVVRCQDTAHLVKFIEEVNSSSLCQCLVDTLEVFCTEKDVAIRIKCAIPLQAVSRSGQ